jgi:hypothetical protein
MCQRNLRVPRGWITVVAVLFLALLGGGLSGSGRIKNRVDGWRVSDGDAVKAAHSLVAAHPAVHNPVGFSGSDQTTVEQWDSQRWRVSGYVDSLPKADVKVRTLYFAVLLHNRTGWDLEDLQLQNMELGSGSAGPKR